MSPAPTRRRAAVSALGLLALAPLARGVRAADAWPQRPIEIVVGFAPGGGTDITARTLAAHLARALGTQVVVTNKAGASGAIGLAHVARAKPDGYTLAMTNFPGLLTLPIERNAGFRPDDFTYLGNLVRDPSAFSTALGSPYATLADLIAAARGAPGTITYGSTGVGTDDHLAMVIFESLTGTRLVHVPFNGAGPLRTAVTGGHVAIAGLNLGEVMPYAGRTLRVLAQAGAERSALGPDVPTFTEQGVALVFASERGLVAPKGLPADVERLLATALERVAGDPEFTAQMRAQFTEMDWQDADRWKRRLERDERQFRQMWTNRPWSA